MITKNFKKLLAMILPSTGGSESVKCYVPVTTLSGVTKYTSTRIRQFPYMVGTGVVLDTSYGIMIGTGTTPATEDDYMLESKITSGVTASGTSHSVNVDESGNPYLEYLFTITNTSENDLTISEIGYVQIINAATSSGTASTSGDYFLMDRTVLDNPVTIAASESAAIKYTLKTIL